MSSNIVTASHIKSSNIVAASHICPSTLFPSVLLSLHAGPALTYVALAKTIHGNVYMVYIRYVEERYL